MTEVLELKNGVRLVFEKIPHVHSATMGIWVTSGSRHEPEPLCGISHFIEHMVFKGTVRRTARDIAEEMDGIGGHINAFTSTECTCFHIRALKTHIELAADILCDMFFHAKFSSHDIRLERSVILEEIDMYSDSPEDLVVDRMSEAAFRGSPLGRPILGTKKSLFRMNHETLCAYRDERYLSKSIIITVSGNYPENLPNFFIERFKDLPLRNPSAPLPAIYRPAITLKTKDIEQNHMCISFPAPSYHSHKKYALRLLNYLLGGGMSSILFQKLREEKGLCYSISSFVNAYSDTGLFSIYTALPENAEKPALTLIHDEISRLAVNKVSDTMLNRAREQYKANLLMSMESTSSRMQSLFYGLIQHGRIMNTDEAVEKIDAVTAEDISNIASDVLDFNNASFSAVGRLKSRDFYRRAIRKP